MTEDDSVEGRAWKGRRTTMSGRATINIQSHYQRQSKCFSFDV